MTDEASNLPTTSATNAAFAALASSTHGVALTRLHRMHRDWENDVVAPALDDAVRAAVQQFAAAMRPAIETMLIEAFQRIELPNFTQALANVELPDFSEAVSAATRQITEQAAAVEAVESSGYRSLLYKLASDHHGLVTTTMAEHAGIPPVEVRKLAARGGLSNLARGLYRVDGIDGGDRGPFAEAVLRVGDDAHLVGESVLAFHDLALVNPRRIAVGTSRRVRRDLPDHIRLVRTRAKPDDLTEYEGVRSVTVERAIRDSIGSIMPDRLIDAVERAAEEGLIRRRVIASLVEEIGVVA